MYVTVEAGDSVWWNYKIVKIAEPAGPSPISGTWYMAQSDGSLGVGPAEFDVSWWNNDEGVTTLRACYFDDAYVFGDDGSFANIQGDETWLETWQGIEVEGCGAPAAPRRTLLRRSGARSFATRRASRGPRGATRTGRPSLRCCIRCRTTRPHARSLSSCPSSLLTLATPTWS